LAEGLRDGLRVACIGPGDGEAARAALADVGDLDRLLTDDAVRIMSVREAYGPGGTVHPDRVVATWAAATEEVLADGFRGLRVSADVTELVRTSEQQDEFARYEFMITRYITAHPLSALCGYDLELGSDTLTDFPPFAARLMDLLPEPYLRLAVVGAES
jgi:MEDS: MEthanogen/methylotroph, DcmR Sensory domain